MTFDAENRLTAVTGGSTNASFVYDADGSRTVGTVDGVNTVYIGGVYEWQAGASTAYYAGPDGTFAFRRSGYATDNGVFYLLRDHPGSSGVIVDGSGNAVKRAFYYPFGGNRGSDFSDLTSKRFTGQYHEDGLPGGEGLSYYNARWYDVQLGRFVSADTIVPNAANPQDLNRLAYARNNPVRFQDPTGHYVFEETPDDPHYSVRRSGSGSSSRSTTRSRTVVSVRSKPQGQWARTGLSNSQYRRAQQQYNRYRAAPESYYANWLVRAGVVEGGRDYISRRMALAEAYSESVLGEYVPAFFDPNYPLEVLYQKANSGEYASVSVPFALAIGGVHKNSHAYVGETHVYVIRGPDGKPFKIGESAQGVRLRDGLSIRAEQQARQFQRYTGVPFETDILKTFPDKQSAYNYQVNLIQRFRSWYGSWTLPGNINGR